MSKFKLIGKGAFSKAYLNDTENKVYLVSNDQIKECMSFGWFPNSDLFPIIERSNIEPYDYMMEYYPRTCGLKSHLDNDQYEIYKTLRAIPIFTGQNKYDSYSHYFEQFEGVRK